VQVGVGVAGPACPSQLLGLEHRARSGEQQEPGRVYAASAWAMPLPHHETAPTAAPATCTTQTGLPKIMSTRMREPPE
jgi:hypothetical protein